MSRPCRAERGAYLEWEPPPSLRLKVLLSLTSRCVGGLRAFPSPPPLSPGGPGDSAVAADLSSTLRPPSVGLCQGEGVLSRASRPPGGSSELELPWEWEAPYELVSMPLSADAPWR